MDLNPSARILFLLERASEKRLCAILPSIGPKELQSGLTRVNLGNPLYTGDKTYKSRDPILALNPREDITRNWW